MLVRKSLANKKRLSQKGDTLIEVLFAVSVFSLVVVLALSVMNQGTAASIRSLQITLVRQEIDSQAEALRFMSSSYIAAYHSGYAPDTTNGSAATDPAEEYYEMIDDIGTGSVTPFGGDDKSVCPTAPSGSFILDTRRARYMPGNSDLLKPADPLSQTIYDGNELRQAQGIWIEAVRSAPSSDPNQTNTRYTDFHIRACWDAPGVGAAMNLGTIVRLYEPANS